MGVSLVSAHVQGMEPSFCRDCLRERWALGPLRVLHPQKGLNSDLGPCLGFFNKHAKGLLGRLFGYPFVGGADTKKTYLTLSLEPPFPVFKRASKYIPTP